MLESLSTSMASTMTMTLTLNSETDTQRLAKQLAGLNLSGSVWLSGDLGAGKTTLTRYWLQALGHSGAVKSPTYTLIEPYEIALQGESGKGKSKPVYHVDLYRLQDPEELSFIGFDEYQDDPNALLIIEWASRAEDYLAPPVLLINIAQVENSSSELKEVRQVQMTVTPQGEAVGINLSKLSGPYLKGRFHSPKPLS